ncbi:MAG: serine hydrolase domain-containing protein [Acidobacteriota bacterium]|nr:serine hydrolase domain-containing protein [Acidobacteriota bacterium]
MKLPLFSLIAAIGASFLLVPRGSAQELPYQIFERYLEPLAQQIGMPGLSAVIVRNNRIEWEKGYGFSDVENKVRATPDTLYPIGGVTQAMSAVLLAICTDRLALEVDTGMRKWVPAFPEDASVRHVLAHVSEGRYVYDPSRYAALTPVVEDCTKRPFRVALADEILQSLAMTSSVPGLDLGQPSGQAARDLFDPARVAQYQDRLTRLAKPYRIDRNRQAQPSSYPPYGLDASGGMVSSARDLAGFEAELDDNINNVPISLSTLDKMWTPFMFDTGAAAPTGQGWFVQTTSQERLVWTFGHIPDAASALIVKMPSKRLTLVLLSNSGGLANTYELEKGDVTTSPFVKIFLRLFI